MSSIPIQEKYALSTKEAVQYFGIGEKKIRRIAQDHPGSSFVVYNGTHILIIRNEFEKFLKETSSI